MNVEDYTFDSFEDGSSKMVGQIQAKKLREFVFDYARQLTKFQETVDSIAGCTHTLPWDTTVDPIALEIAAKEHLSVPDLAQSENKLFTKIMTVFGFLSQEIMNLKETAEKEFYPPLVMFDFNEGEGEDENSAEGDVQIAVGKMLDLLLKLAAFTNRVYAVVQSLVRQLGSLYHSKQKMYTTSFKDVHLVPMFEKLGELLRVLIILDELISGNKSFVDAWTRYSRMIKNISRDPARFKVEEVKLQQFEKLMFSVKGYLVDGFIYQNCIEQEFDFPGLVEIRTSKSFKNEFFSSIKFIYNNVLTRLGDIEESDPSYDIISLCALYVLHVAIFRDISDKKFFRQLFDIHKKIPIVHVYGNASWFPGEFLSEMVPQMMKQIDSDIVAARKDFLKNHMKEFQSQVRHFYMRCSIWMAQMESSMTNRAGMKDIIASRVQIVAQGLLLASKVRGHFLLTVNLHLYLQVSLRIQDVRGLCLCVQLLKAIESTCHRRSAVLGESYSLMMQQSCFAIQNMLLPLKKNLEDSKTLKDSKLDLLASVNSMIMFLGSSVTPLRLNMLNNCFAVVCQPNAVRYCDVEDIANRLRVLGLICNFQNTLRTLTDCSFLYWNREMIPKYFADIYDNPESAQLQYIMLALEDIIPIMKRAVHEDPTVLIDSFETEIEGFLHENILHPLQRDIEIDLRLHIHSHLNVSDRSPFKNGVKDFSRFLRMGRIQFNGHHIDFESLVTHYLDTTFYNLNTVALYDWKTYEEMRNLAKEKYDLTLTEVHLPGQTLEQGLDVLEIMRNIHVFVANYAYNLNSQFFIEMKSESKSLNTINVMHVANSIRTHGTGIMNTAVNFTYQLLRQKFAIFSQFLYDDHIKSRLYKDIKFFRDSKDQLDCRYPFDRAERFNKDIRKLGVTEDSQTFLDKFRVLITQIGNAMGYIRLIRSGGLLHTSNAIKFVPDLQNIENFEELVQADKLNNETLEAAKNVDEAIENLAKSFEGGVEYFNILVNVFAGEFRNPNNSHLQNFYIIVPPLTLNFIGNMLLSKEKIMKKSTKFYHHDSYIFTDDGFAIGVAYILRLLNQNSEFDTLHWFESVHNYYTQEIKKVELQASKRSKEQQETASLTLKRLKNHLREYELLRFSFAGAKIFFDN